MDFKLVQATAILERTPATLRTFLSGLPDAWIVNNDGKDTWSPFDILGHLIHGERTDWIPRLRIILEHGTTKTFEPFDRFAQQTTSQGKSLAELLETFEKLRFENLAVLKNLQLQPADLDRQGIHPDLGRVSLRELLATWVVHDLSHVAQAAEVMACQYRAQVGPWAAYLPVLER